MAMACVLSVGVVGCSLFTSDSSRNKAVERGSLITVNRDSFCEIVSEAYPFDVKNPRSIDATTLRKILYVEKSYEQICLGQGIEDLE